MNAIHPSADTMTPSHGKPRTDRNAARFRPLHPSLVAVLAGLALSAFGCAETSPASQGDEESLLEPSALALSASSNKSRSKNALVAQADLPGRTIQFLEPAPGLLVEFETGSAAEVLEATTANADDLELSSVERYEALTGKSAPAQLVRAQELVDEVALRQRATHKATPAAELAPIEHGVTKGTSGPQLVDRQWFRNSYCKATDRTKFWLDASGSTSLVKDGANYLRAGVFCTTGLVHYYGSYSNGLAQNDRLEAWLSAGQYGALRMSSTFNATFGSTVDYADGDVYDHCLNYHF